MKPDIQTRADIQIFVDAFYAKMHSDDLVGHVFMDVMHVDFAKHLPKMYDFWEMLLLDGSAYKGAPMRPHLEVNQKVRLTQAHFDRWLSLFNATLNEHFEGKITEEAKIKAWNIAQTWAYKLNYLNQQADESTSFRN
jgi:hemoglobin